MAVSGTVSTTTFNTMKVIDHAFRRCRMLPQEVTSEMISIAKDNLYLLLSSLGSIGVPLWCIEKEILPLYIGQSVATPSKGTMDILNANYRWLTRQTGPVQYSSAGGIVEYAFDGDLDTSCEQTSINGNIEISFIGSDPILDPQPAVQVTTVGIMMATTGTFNLNFEWSNDGVTWTSCLIPGATVYTAGRWHWYDIDGTVPVNYFRMRETGGNTLNVVEFYASNNPTEIPLARMNRDDWTNFPNKTFQGRPLQYWFDRQRDYPTMQMWPVTDSTSMFGQFVIWKQRYIMDVGAVTDELDIPQRWYETIVWQLSWRLAMELPNFDMSLLPSIKQTADEALKIAHDEERDNSPIYFTPNISPYTR